MKLSDLAKRMILTILTIALICTLASAIYYRSLGFLPFMFGTVLGSVVSILKVFLLEWAVDKALTMDQRRAVPYLGFQHVFRLAISGVALYLGAVVPQINLWGVVAGILSFQAATFNIKSAQKDA